MQYSGKSKKAISSACSAMNARPGLYASMWHLVSALHHTCLQSLGPEPDACHANIQIKMGNSQPVISARFVIIIRSARQFTILRRQREWLAFVLVFLLLLQALMSNACCSQRLSVACEWTSLCIRLVTGSK